MIRDLGDGRFWVTVISKGRPENVETMRALIGDATWYVPGDEIDAYEEAGATAWGVGGGLCAARNKALVQAIQAAPLGVPCIQLSDDLTAIAQLALPDDGEGKPTAEPISFEEGVMLLDNAAYEMGARLAGGAPTSNAFYASPRVAPNLFILGDFMLIHPTELRFDERLRLKEDYDYTCQHVARYGAVARVGYLIPTFKHRTNAGGAVADRTPELEQASIGILKEKWGPWVRDNPRRPNEILLKIPRPKGPTLL